MILVALIHGQYAKNNKKSTIYNFPKNNWQLKFHTKNIKKYGFLSDLKRDAKKIKSRKFENYCYILLVYENARVVWCLRDYVTLN